MDSWYCIKMCNICRDNVINACLYAIKISSVTLKSANIIEKNVKWEGGFTEPRKGHRTVFLSVFLSRYHKMESCYHKKLSRSYKLASRYHKLASRYHKVESRSHKIASRSHQLLSRSHNLESRSHKITSRSHKL